MHCAAGRRTMTGRARYVMAKKKGFSHGGVIYRSRNKAGVEIRPEYTIISISEAYSLNELAQLSLSASPIL